MQHRRWVGTGAGIAMASVLLITTAAAAASPSEVLPACGETVVGEPVPWLSGWTMNDDVFNVRKPFSEPETQRLALVFWATWCAPCRHGMARLEESSRALESAGVRVALVNVAQDRSEIAAFLKDHTVSFPVVLDPYGNCKEPFLIRPTGHSAIPLTVLVDRDGIVENIIGKEGDDYIDLLLAGLLDPGGAR